MDCLFCEKKFLATSILFSISLFDLASCDIMLPKYTKLLACFIFVVSIIMLQFGGCGFFEATATSVFFFY